jgi:GntR family transcriptional regulator
MVDPPKKGGRGRRRESSDIPIAGSRELDRESAVPLYYQLAAALKDKLDTGNWRPGSRFPTEREIAEEFGVSRSVIRPALDLLVGDGAIVREQGSGAFVTAPRLEFPIFGLIRSLAEPPAGLVPTILATSEELPEPAVARFLEIKPPLSPIVHVSALFHFEKKPICFMESYSSATLVPWILKMTEDLRDGSQMARPQGPALGSTKGSIELSFFGPWAGPQLEASAGDPALISRLVQFSRPEGTGRRRPLEFAYAVYRTDITQLAFEFD